MLCWHISPESVYQKLLSPNTSGRYTAENSLISAMALLCVIAATHCFVVPEYNPDMYREISEASEGVKILFDVLQHVHDNAPLFFVRPELIFSTDDTVQYIFEGKGVEKEKFVLVSTKSQQQSGTRAKYKVANSKCMMGMRVKLTYTFSAAATVAPIFVTVLGLTERELK